MGLGELGIRGQLLGQSLSAVDDRYGYGDYVSLVHASVRHHQHLDRYLYVAGPFLIFPKQGSATSFTEIALLVCESLVPEPTGGSVEFYASQMYRHVFRVIRVSDSIHHL